jgi:hypothetical protein
LGFVTVTHPHHPLSGQKVALIRLRRGSQPDLIVRLADGSHAAVAVTMTDYGRAADAPDAPTARPPHPSFLDLESLRELARLIAQFQQ